MSKKAKIRAAGAVALRGTGDDIEVLLIHRGRYNDWSLPKGKGKVAELPPVTAVREVLEETGVTVSLGMRLPRIRYNVPKGAKTVDYWRAEVVHEGPFEPNAEVDKVRWMSIAQAMKKMTYADERRVLSAALLAPHSTPLLLVRHAKAMLRKDWSGRDQDRRITARGRRQADRLRPLLGAYGTQELISSSSARCMQTLAPYAAERGLSLHAEEMLTEEEGTVRPKDVRRYMAGLLAGLEVPTAICGHRPVLPSMFEGLGLDPRPMVVSEVIVIHRDDERRRLAVEVHKPTA